MVTVAHFYMDNNLLISTLDYYQSKCLPVVFLASIVPFVAFEGVQMVLESLPCYYSHCFSKTSECDFSLLPRQFAFITECLLSFDVRLCIDSLMNVCSCQQT